MGIGNGGLIGHQASQNGDENVNLLLNNKNALNVKSAQTTTTTTSASQNAPLFAQAKMDTGNGSSGLIPAQSAPSLLAASLQLQLNRNALGDIGNRIGNGGSSAALLSAKPSAKSAQLDSLKSKSSQQLSQVQPVAMAPQTTLQQQSSNNSCIMVEVESDEDEELIEVEEQEIAEQDVNILNKKCKMPRDVVDIDEADVDNTQLVSEYVKDIYTYLNQMEVREASFSFIYVYS